jgi:hypothetical protein
MPKRELLVIDNAPLRLHSLQASQKILEKMERLEEKIRRFHSTDQKLFHEWFEVTFRSHRATHEKAQGRYIELVRFHNWVVATARKLKIEMHTAYRLMCAEQIRWNNGDETVRQQINQDRSEREAYIREQSRSHYSGEFHFDDDNSAEREIGGLSETLDRLEEVIFGDERDFLENAEDRIQRLACLANECLSLYISMHDTGFMLFDVSLTWGEHHGDYSLFKKIWTLMHPQQRNYFAGVYASLTDMPIEDLLQRLGISEDEEEEILSRPEEERPESVELAKIQKQNTGNDEKLKQVFRKLMRRLHPDMHATALPSWAPRTWSLVQKAYSDKNLPKLERLLVLVQIRTNALDELTISDMTKAQSWLNEDFENLNEESKSLKNSMAWGFSGKKKYDTLKKRIENDFARDLKILMEEIEVLEQQHQMLEILAEQDYKPQRSGQYSRRGRPKKRYSDSAQQSFDFENEFLS